jgi:hypothetical protein
MFASSVRGFAEALDVFFVAAVGFGFFALGGVVDKMESWRRESISGSEPSSSVSSLGFFFPAVALGLDGAFAGFFAGAAFVTFEAALGFTVAAFFGAGFAFAFCTGVGQIFKPSLHVEENTLLARLARKELTAAATGEKASESSWSSKTESTMEESMIGSASIRVLTRQTG